jgi:hypothetical protein
MNLIKSLTSTSSSAATTSEIDIAVCVKSASVEVFEMVTGPDFAVARIADRIGSSSTSGVKAECDTLRLRLRSLLSDSRSSSLAFEGNFV